jgi:hypothetical protein
MSTNESTDGSSFDNSEISLPRSVRFWLLILFDIPSIVCAFLLLYHLIHDSTIRKALNNHVIILLLILGLTAQLIEIPFYLAFIANSGIVKPSVPATCFVWWVVSIAMYNAGTLLMAWTAIERHIIIYKFQWLSARRGRILAHYLPIAIILLYVFSFYTYAFFFFPCENDDKYFLPICGASPCYQADLFIGKWEFIVNNIVPSLIVALMSITLLIRVVRQKRRLNRPNQWRKQRKMTIQLVSLSVLNVAFNIPLNLISLARLCGLPEDYGIDAQQYFYFSCYFLVFLFPYVCLISYPELVSKVKRKILCKKVRPNVAFVSTAWITNKNS